LKTLETLETSKFKLETIHKVNATNGATAQTRMPYTFGKLGGSAGN
jgi:hypothetical protein